MAVRSHAVRSAALAIAVCLGPIATVTAAQAPPTLDSPAARLRVDLGRLLGEHAFLTMESMRSAALGTEDASALRGGLDANSAALEEAIGGVYGPEGGGAFGDLWREHIELLVRFASARAAGDDAAEQLALDGLDAYRRAFTVFLMGANEHFEGDAEAEALQLHLDQLVAFASGDYERAYATHRDAFRHMFALGDHLARGIGEQFPERFSGADIAFSPSADLRLTLDRLLAEHLVLSAEAMRAGLTGAPDLDAARTALDANGGDLGAALGRFYGDDAGTAFTNLWGDHVAAYLAFVESVASGDADGRAESLAALHAYHDRLATFLAGANPHLPAATVSDLISRHVQSLITQVEAWEAQDYPRSVASVRSAYDFMFVVGDALATGIVQQFPDRFTDIEVIPRTEAAEARDGLDWRLLPLALALVAAAVIAVLRRSPTPAASRRRLHTR